ncbi:hypothetical protein GCM10022393_01360 [Aquimarina addita]|uniref:Peptidylprolyl isomerase n=1 Tax=Aquimarina addita TaxID=870485 RepID=A0ABP7X7R8_9FLAO
MKKYIVGLTLVIAAIYGCSNDDDDSDVITVELRDFAEQQADEELIIESYLKTHFYDSIDNPANSDYKIIIFDTIAGENSDRTPIWESELLETKTATFDEVDYTLYLLRYSSGVATERKPTFADSTLVTYRGELFYDNLDDDVNGVPDNAQVDTDDDGNAETDMINGVEVTRVDTDGDGIADIADIDSNAEASDSDGDGVIDDYDTVDNNDPGRRVFDSTVTPVWLDLVSIVGGFREAVTEFSGASGFSENPTDGTISYEMNFGNYTVFMPSGLGYFNNLQSSIPAYSPLIFTVQLYASEEADHDGDGVPSYLEDIDGDRIVNDLDEDSNDDTDDDGIPNYADTDDDGDGTLTEDEDLEADQDINVDRDGDGDATNDLGDGNPMNDDTDGDGVPNYLDTDNEESRDD